MTKKEIVLELVAKYQVSYEDAQSIVQTFFDLIIGALVDEGRIELRNFGVFEVKRRSARTALNPKTGERVSVPERLGVTFKPGKAMQQQVKQCKSPHSG